MPYSTLANLEKARKFAHDAYQGVYLTSYYVGPWYRFTLLHADGDVRYVNIETGDITKYRPVA